MNPRRPAGYAERAVSVRPVGVVRATAALHDSAASGEPAPHRALAMKRDDTLHNGCMQRQIEGVR